MNIYTYHYFFRETWVLPLPWVQSTKEDYYKHIETGKDIARKRRGGMQIHRSVPRFAKIRPPAITTTTTTTVCKVVDCLFKDAKGSGYGFKKIKLLKEKEIKINACTICTTTKYGASWKLQITCTFKRCTNGQNPHQLSPQEAALLSSRDIAMPVNSSLWSLVWYNSY